MITYWIKECTNGWDISHSAEWDELDPPVHVHTAAEALKWVKDIAAFSRSEVVISVIEWVPATRIGLMVVKALQ